MFKVNNKVIIKTPGPRQSRRYGIFIVNFEHMSHLVLVFLLGMAYFITSKSKKPIQNKINQKFSQCIPRGNSHFSPSFNIFQRNFVRTQIIRLPRTCRKIFVT